MKNKKFIVLTTLALTLASATTTFAKRNVGDSGPITNQNATFELYYHYKDEDPAYKGQHRLSLSIYDISKYMLEYTEPPIIYGAPNEQVVTKTLANVNITTNEVLNLFPKLRNYKDEVDYQLFCHFVGDLITTKKQNEWDIEIQRVQPLLGPINEIGINILGYELIKPTHCNNASWKDQKLIFHANTTFKGQTVLPNKWIYFDTKNGGREWYFVNENYEGTTGWKNISNNWYYFDDLSIMKTGWLNYNNDWYYLVSSGEMSKGLINAGGNYYYFVDSGELVTKGWINYNNKWYYPNENGGSLFTNYWKKIDGDWYYFNSDATMKVGWLRYNNNWYFLNSSGRMVTGWNDLGGSKFYFTSSGDALTGIKQIGGEYYEFDNDGRLIRKINKQCSNGNCAVPFNSNSISEASGGASQ